VLVVQERRRFYRESMTAYLRRQLTTEVLEGVGDREALLDATARSPLTHAVVEADNVPWDVAGLARSMHRQRPGLQLIGLTTSARAGPLEGLVLIPRSTSPEQVVELVEPSRGPVTPFVLSVSGGDGNGPLTGQQLRVLALLSLGLTAAGVGARLGLSERAVARSKIAIFTKLGARSQAQAVATALATGLLGPAGVTGANPPG
jgi:DNA-binding NarL/FixJ family response regulator